MKEVILVLVKEKEIYRLNIDKVLNENEKTIYEKLIAIGEKYKDSDISLRENGDAMEYYRDHPEAQWDELIKNFEGSEIKFQNWCHKAYLGPHGPKGADQGKYDKAMSYFESHKNKPLTESLQYEDILNMSMDTLKQRNDGKINQTLRELNALMSTIQGADDENQRKAYFKAKKYHQQLAEFMNDDKS